MSSASRLVTLRSEHAIVCPSCEHEHAPEGLGKRTRFDPAVVHKCHACDELFRTTIAAVFVTTPIDQRGNTIAGTLDHRGAPSTIDEHGTRSIDVGEPERRAAEPAPPDPLENA